MSKEGTPPSGSKDKRRPLGSSFTSQHAKFEGDDKASFTVVDADVACDPAGALLFVYDQSQAPGMPLRVLTQTDQCWLPAPVTGTRTRISGPLCFYPVQPGPIVLDLKLWGEREVAASQGAPAKTITADTLKQVPLKFLTPRAGGTASPRGDVCVVTKDGRKKPLPTPMLQYCGGDLKPGVAGIRFYCTVERPARTFTYHLLQTCTGYRRYTLLDGKAADGKPVPGEPFITSTGTKPFLDTNIQYKSQEDSDSDEEGPAKFHAEDSPGTPLYEWCKEVEVNETFHMYLACRPRSGPSVTFARVTWFWRARALRTGPGKADWNVTFKEIPDAPSLPFQPTTEQAQWHGNVTTMGMEIEAMRRDAEARMKKMGAAESKKDQP